MAGFWRPAKIGRISGLVLATLLVLFALVVSLIRSLLPQLHQARDKVTEYLWDNYQVKVELAELSAEWQAFGPALTVTGLVLPPQDGLPLSLVVERTEVKLDFWQTLLERSPSVESVEFDGVKLMLDLDSLAADPQTDKPLTDKPASRPTKPASTDWLYKLLLEQMQHFKLREAMVELKSRHHDFRPIYVGDLRWQNLGSRHRAEGYVYLDVNASRSERLQLQIDLHGNGNVPDSIHGQAYLLANSLDLGEWAARQTNPSDAKSPISLAGVVNLQAWAEVANRSLSSILVQFDPSYLEWAKPNAAKLLTPAELSEIKDEALPEPKDGNERLEVISGAVVWKKHGRGWVLGSDGLALASNGNDWPAPEFAAKFDGQRLVGALNALDIAALLPLAPFIPGLDEQGVNDMLTMAPTGRIDDLRVNWQAALSADASSAEALAAKKDAPASLGNWQASARVAGLGWFAKGAIPGLSPINAKLYANNQEVRVSLAPQNLTLDFANEFKAPLSFDTPGIELSYRFDDQSLLSPSVALANDDLSLDAAVKFSFSPEPHLALAADVTVHDASRAGYYFPRNAMGVELADYLEGAIITGRTEQAAVVWQGALANFPYDDGSGVFQAGFVLTDGHYAFQPDWPAVTELTLRALFENARMDIWVDEGKLKQVDVAGAYVSIPEMSEQTLLKVEAALATTGPAATAVLKQSPLKETVGSVLSVVQVQGKVRGDLDLTIPLYEEGEADIRGLVLFDDTPVYLDSPGLQLTRLRGELSFINDEINAKGLNARVFGQPITFDVSGKESSEGYRVRSSLKGGWDIARLPSSFTNPLSPFYQGVLAWQGKLTLDFPEDGDFSLDASAQSSLRNLALNLPAPFNKPMGEQRALNLSVTGTSQALALGITLGEQADFRATINPATGLMDDYRLSLSDGSKKAPITPDALIANALTPSKEQSSVLSSIPVGQVADAAANVAVNVAANAIESVKGAVGALEQPLGQALSDGLAAVGIDAPKSLTANNATTEGDADANGLAHSGSANMATGANPNEVSVATVGTIDVALASADFDEWLEVINSFVAQSNSAQESASAEAGRGFFPPLGEIQVRLGALKIFGQELTSPRIQASPQDTSWRISAEAPEFAGDIDIYSDWRQGGMKINASRLYLGSSNEAADKADGSVNGKENDKANLGLTAKQTDETQSNRTHSDPTSLPPLTIDVDDFRLYGKRLGQLALQGQPQATSYRFDTLTIRSDAATLKGQGEWMPQGDGQQTTFNFTLAAPRFDALTAQLGIDPDIKDSPLELKADLYWQGAPQDFALAGLSGKASFSFGKGSLSEVSDKGARLFSLFSLDSLVRKLSLDFSDVFGKGLYYHSFSGNLELDNGVVKTRDTEIDAIAGNMKVRGYTDLSTKSLNYDIRFVPQLASSVPTVVLLSTSAWTMGLGAFALTKVLEPVIEVISEIRFRLTGTLSEPVIEELERKSKEIEIPESVLPTVSQPDASKAQLTTPLKAPAAVAVEAKVSKTQTLGPQTLGPEALGHQALDPQKLDSQSLDAQAPQTMIQEPAVIQPPLAPVDTRPELKQEPELKPEPEPQAGLIGHPWPLQWINTLSDGELHAGQSAAMPKQPRCSGESSLYRIAA